MTRAPRYVPAITGVFWIAVAVAIIALWPAPDGILYWVRGAAFALPFLFGLDSLRIALFGSDEQIRAAVDGEESARAGAPTPGLTKTVWRLMASRTFVIAVITCAVAAFFFVEYRPALGALGNVMQSSILLDRDCDWDTLGRYSYAVAKPTADRVETPVELQAMRKIVEQDRPGATCGIRLPYRWIALSAVLLAGAHVVIQARHRS